jgi:ribosomal protein S18 acetylase RimI-like enzyme
MAVTAPIGARRLVDLRKVSPGAIQPLLEEEIDQWNRILHWDFRPSAAMLTRYIGYRALDGLALCEGSEIAGYCYWVCEGRKALLGDLFVRQPWRGMAAENSLLRGALDTLAGWPDMTAQPGLPAAGWIRRIEAQLMMLSIHGPQVLPQGPLPRTFRRFFMIGSLHSAVRLRPVSPPPGYRFDSWMPSMIGDLALLVERCYQGHIDSEINDQYRTTEGARRFLENLTNYPGCGTLQPAASWILLDAAGTPQGLVLCTSVSGSTGHVAQICTAPHLRGSGVGYELMRRAMLGLLAQGSVEASLTVTAANARALSMYRRLGFATTHEFDALVWSTG